MASTPDPLLRLELQANGENNNTWGAPKLNLALTDVAFAIAGRTAFALSGTKTLTANNYTTDESRSMMLDVTSGTGGTITVPAVSHVYMVRNATSGAVILTVGSGATASVATGNIGWVMVTGTDCYLVTTATATASSWTTPRDFTTTGDGTVAFTGVNGASNVTGTMTIGNSAVTLAKQANYATNGLQGNNSGGSSVPLLLSFAAVTAALSAAVGDTGSGGTKGLVPAPAAGDAAKVLSGAMTYITPSSDLSAGTIGTKALTQPGYVKLGPIYIQWGSINTTLQTTYTVTFPVAFPTACLSIVCNTFNPTADATKDYWGQVVNTTTTTADLFNQGSGGSSTSALLWLAIGY